jgi:hypothetical protein
MTNMARKAMATALRNERPDLNPFNLLELMTSSPFLQLSRLRYGPTLCPTVANIARWVFRISTYIGGSKPNVSWRWSMVRVMDQQSIAKRWNIKGQTVLTLDCFGNLFGFERKFLRGKPRSVRNDDEIREKTPLFYAL